MVDLKANKRDFTLLFLVMLITGAGNTALQSVLPTLGRTIGVADSVIAAAFSVSAAIWVYTAPRWARRSDKDGRREMVMLGLTGFISSVGLCGIVLSLGLHGVLGPLVTMLAFIAARMLYGIFGAAAPPAAQAMVALRTSRKERTKALTMLGSAFGLGTILGPAAAPWLVGLPVVGLAGPAFVFAAFGSIVLVFVWRYLRDDTPSDAGRGAAVSYPSIGGAPTGGSVTVATSPQSKPLALRDPRIWPWMLLGLIMGHAQAMTGQAVGFLVIDRLHLPLAHSQEAIGIVLMIGAAAALLVQWGLIPLFNLEPRVMMVIGLVISALGCATTGVADSLYGISTAYALACIGFGFSRPAFTAGASLSVDRKLQGSVAGRVTSVNGAAFVLGPSIGVGLYELWGPLPYFLSAAILALLIPYVLVRIKPTTAAASEW